MWHSHQKILWNFSYSKTPCQFTGEAKLCKYKMEPPWHMTSSPPKIQPKQIPGTDFSGNLSKKEMDHPSESDSQCSLLSYQDKNLSNTSLENLNKLSPPVSGKLVTSLYNAHIFLRCKCIIYPQVEARSRKVRRLLSYLDELLGEGASNKLIQLC